MRGFYGFVEVLAFVAKSCGSKDMIEGCLKLTTHLSSHVNVQQTNSTYTYLKTIKLDTMLYF